VGKLGWLSVISCPLKARMHRARAELNFAEFSRGERAWSFAKLPACALCLRLAFGFANRAVTRALHNDHGAAPKNRRNRRCARRFDAIKGRVQQ
jgi:hypothetical protein